MIFNYNDFYFIFILIFLLVFNTIFNNSYVNRKIFIYNYENIKTNKSIFTCYCFIIMFFFFILNMVLLSENFNLNININLNLCYKYIFCIFCIFYFYLLISYTKIFKFYNFEFIWVYLFSIFCLNLLVDCDNFLYFYLILESYSLSVICVLAFKRVTKKSLSASVYYLIINIIASCLILYSISLIYFSCNLLFFNDINIYLLVSNCNYLNFSLIILIVCFLIKLSAFPFSLLFVEIYSKLSNIFIFFFLIVPKFCFLIIIFKNFYCFLNVFVNDYFNYILYVVCVTSILHSALSTYCINIKYLIINTSIANLPFLMSPLIYKTFFLLNSYLNFIVIYFFNVYMFILVIYYVLSNYKLQIKKISAISGYYYKNISLSFCMFIIFSSLCSMPPFSGFFSKLFILHLFVEYKFYILYFLLSFLNLLIVFAYIKLFKNILIKKRNISTFATRFSNNIFFYIVISIFCFININFVSLFDFFYKYVFISINILILI